MPVISCNKQVLVIGPKGEVWGQGTNSSHQLGEGTQGLYFHDPAIISDLPPIVSVEAQRHSMFLDEEGRVWALGRNEDNFLGEPYFTIKKPYMIPGLPPIKMFSAGDRHVLFLDYEGRVWGLGDNQDGRLGADINIRSSVITEPILIPHEKTIIQVSVGSTYSFILDNEGNVWATGSGTYNEHGLMPDEFFEREDMDGDIEIFQFTPVPHLPPMKKILAGNAHSIGLTRDDEVVVFGLLEGEGVYDDIIVIPTIIPDLPPIEDISIGTEDNLAITKDGEVYIISMIITSDDQTLPRVGLVPSQRYRDIAANLSDSAGSASFLVDRDDRVWKLNIEGENSLTTVEPFFDLVAKNPSIQLEPQEEVPLLSYDLIEGLFKQEKVRDYRVRDNQPDSVLMEFELTDDSLYLGYVNYIPDEDHIYLSEEIQSEMNYFDDLTRIIKQHKEFPEHELRPDFYTDEKGNQAFYFVDTNAQRRITLVSVFNGTIYPPN